MAQILVEMSFILAWRPERYVALLADALDRLAALQREVTAVMVSRCTVGTGCH
jgi:hypothetical protein